MAEKLTKAQRKTLAHYADTGYWKFLQSFPESTDLMVKGLLEFRGESYGSRFYSITEAGRRAIGGDDVS